MQYRGELKDPGNRFGILATHWNEDINQNLVRGALETFAKHNVQEEQIDQIWVPGALELPLAAQRLALSQNYCALIALGCVIKGETAHFEIVARESCRCLTLLSLEFDMPIMLGVLTVYNRDQAIDRSGPNDRNKGAECAASALQMVNVLDALPSE